MGSNNMQEGKVTIICEVKDNDTFWYYRRHPDICGHEILLETDVDWPVGRHRPPAGPLLYQVTRETTAQSQAKFMYCVLIKLDFKVNC